MGRKSFCSVVIGQCNVGCRFCNGVDGVFESHYVLGPSENHRKIFMRLVNMVLLLVHFFLYEDKFVNYFSDNLSIEYMFLKNNRFYYHYFVDDYYMAEYIFIKMIEGENVGIIYKINILYSKL